MNSMAHDQNEVAVRHTDVVIIGAGPSGCSAAALLRQKGYQVMILEKQYFPRFSIGESLLPQSMVFLEQAGLLDTIRAHQTEYAFQLKNGAAFLRGKARSAYDFTEKFTEGPGITWQVKRAHFDQLVADAVQQQGADVRFGHEVLAVDVTQTAPSLTVKDPKGQVYRVQGKFLLDASGFGRILPKMLDLEAPSDFPVRRAVFGHIIDGITEQADFDRHKILITVHEKDHRAWYWLIPFADGTSSFGVVAEQDFFDHYGFAETSPDALQALFEKILADDVALSTILKEKKFISPVRSLVGYSANVKYLAQHNFALLGNAGEFLDPVFSSGITIALKSSSLVVPLVERTLAGESVDWQQEYEQPLRQGIQVFRAYVEAWYQGDFQDVVFATAQNDKIRRMISSLLAGYAWDAHNPIHKNAEQRLRTLASYCREQRESDSLLEIL